MLAFFEKHGIIYMLSAGVAEWQTHVTQNHAERSVPVRVRPAALSIPGRSPESYCFQALPGFFVFGESREKGRLREQFPEISSEKCKTMLALADLCMIPLFCVSMNSYKEDLYRMIRKSKLLICMLSMCMILAAAPGMESSAEELAGEQQPAAAELQDENSQRLETVTGMDENGGIFTLDDSEGTVGREWDFALFPYEQRCESGELPDERKCGDLLYR